MRLRAGLLAGVMVLCPGLAGAELPAMRWQRAHKGLRDIAVRAVAVHPVRPDRIFAAGRRSVYAAADAGQRWKELFQVPAQVTVTGLAVDGSEPPAILVATDRGLYGSFDGGVEWSRVLRGTDEGAAACTHVAFHPSRAGTALLATRGGLFRSVDGGRRWSEVPIPAQAREVIHFAVDPEEPNRLHLLSADGLFTGDLADGVWQRRFSPVPITAGDGTDAPAEEPSEPDAQGGDDAEDSSQRLSAIAVDPQDPSTLYVAGSRGLERSRDGGASWQRLPQTGLLSPAISRIALQAHSPVALYAATSHGLARYDSEQERWTMTAQGLAAGAETSLRVHFDTSRARATGYRLYLFYP